MSIDIPTLTEVQGGEEWAYSAWEPEKPLVVMGRSGIEEKEVFSDNCLEDGVPIFRRITGGGTALLSPGMLVFSFAQITDRALSIKFHQRRINGMIIEFLEGLGVKNLSEKGISDICIGERKVLGSGMYIGKNVLFFQGSLLVNPDLSLMEMYLRHPGREPEYRKGRRHLDFLTTLREEGYDFEAGALLPDFRIFLKGIYERK